jgi:general secretion pathway protein C
MAISSIPERSGGARIMSGLLAIGCAALLAALAVRLSAPTPVLAPLPASTAARPDIERVGRLFGVPASARDGAGPAEAVDPSLRLTGVIVEGDRSLALISINGGPARALPVGAALGSMNRLVEIGAERVIVARDDGRRFELRVPQRGSGTSGKEVGRGEGRPGSAPVATPSSSAPRR